MHNFEIHSRELRILKLLDSEFWYLCISIFCGLLLNDGSSLEYSLFFCIPILANLCWLASDYNFHLKNPDNISYVLDLLIIILMAGLPMFLTYAGIYLTCGIFAFNFTKCIYCLNSIIMFNLYVITELDLKDKNKTLGTFICSVAFIWVFQQTSGFKVF
jgi:hypothetical protein